MSEINWVDINDEIPGIDERVIVFIPDIFDVRISRRVPNSNRYNFPVNFACIVSDGSEIIHQPSHWAKFPYPPGVIACDDEFHDKLFDLKNYHCIYCGGITTRTVMFHHNPQGLSGYDKGGYWYQGAVNFKADGICPGCGAFIVNGHHEFCLHNKQEEKENAN